MAKKRIPKKIENLEHVWKPSFVATCRNFRARPIFSRRGIAVAISRREKPGAAEKDGKFAEYEVFKHALVRGYARRLREEKKLPVSRVLVFGSQVTGKARPDSDIDVCIVSPRLAYSHKSLQLLWGIRNRDEVLAGLEPVGYSEEDFLAGSTLISEIERTELEVSI